MMAAPLYRVVETSWVGGERVTKDIGTKPVPLPQAREQVKKLNSNHPLRLFSIEKTSK